MTKLSLIYNITAKSFFQSLGVAAICNYLKMKLKLQKY